MSKTDHVKLKATERRAFVFELRKQGLSYRAIAERALWEYGPDDLPKGYDSRIAWLDVNYELKKIREQLSSDVAAVRAMELERLDALQNAIWEEAATGNLGAIEKVLKIMKRRADVMGIDAASKHLVQSLDMAKLTEEQLERLAAGDNVFDVLFAKEGGSGYDRGTEEGR